MTKEILIDIGADATVNALHFDELPLDFLGKMRVRRATEIKYDETNGYWTIVPPGNDIGQSSIDIQGFTSYGAARDFEVAWVQECMSQSVKHFTSQGYKIALHMLEQRKSPLE